MSGEKKFNAIAYWLERHNKFKGSHLATGLCGSPFSANTILYRLRKKALLETIGEPHILYGKKVLDAGCGYGGFAKIYKSLGAEVYGCDISPIAVEFCNQKKLGTFKCGHLADVHEIFPNIKFDYVNCFDVLYHVIEDSVWVNCLISFNKVSKTSTIWYFTEFSKSPKRRSQHVRIRTREKYEQELKKLSRTIDIEKKFHMLFGFSPKFFLRYPRIGYVLEYFCKNNTFRKYANSSLWKIISVKPKTGQIN